MSDDRTAIAEEEDVVDEQETETEPEADEPAEDAEPEAEEAEVDRSEEDEPVEGEDEIEEPPQGRQETRVQRLANERRRLREENERLNRELEKSRAPRQQEQPRETPQQRQERLALMDPDQRTQYLLDEQRYFNDQRFSQLERTTLAVADKSGFDATCSRKPHFDAVRDEVESEFQRLMGEGRFVPRETLAKYIIGDRIDKRGGIAKGQQARRGRERVAQQRTRPQGGGSDVRGERRPRGDSAAAREQRLKDQEI